MFKQIFLSEPPQYRLPGELNPSLFGSIQYNEYLITPPRIYAEEIYSVAGMWVSRRASATTDVTIHLACWGSQIYWPSWELIIWSFDATTGEFLGVEFNSSGDQVGFPGGYYQGPLYVSRDNSIWMVTLTTLYELDPITMKVIQPGIPASRFEGHYSYPTLLVDRPSNQIIMASWGQVTGIDIYNFTTGAFIKRVDTPGTVTQIIAEDDRRCFVFTEQQMLCLIDYEVGDVIATYRNPLGISGYNSVRFTFDRVYRRLLAFGPPVNDSTGACITGIKGWYPVPIATAISPPIPLKPIRDNVTIPVLVQSYGDAGEPIAGQIIGVQVTGNAVLDISCPATDNQGDSVFFIEGTAEGTTTVNITAQVPDPV